ncbi:MAG: hypothetical protein MZV70_17135 [Desulfobacterales bacterium]|nr:hypothetical protein [Desulfobacterales bacterium]
MVGLALLQLRARDLNALAAGPAAARLRGRRGGAHRAPGLPRGLAHRRRRGRRGRPHRLRGPGGAARAAPPARPRPPGAAAGLRPWAAPSSSSGVIPSPARPWRPPRFPSACSRRWSVDRSSCGSCGGARVAPGSGDSTCAASCSSRRSSSSGPARPPPRRRPAQTPAAQREVTARVISLGRDIDELNQRYESLLKQNAAIEKLLVQLGFGVQMSADTVAQRVELMRRFERAEAARTATHEKLKGLLETPGGTAQDRDARWRCAPDRSWCASRRSGSSIARKGRLRAEATPLLWAVAEEPQGAGRAGASRWSPR